MAIRKFERGQSTYSCRVCKKRTRNVGGYEGNVTLCLNCFTLAEIENHLLDNDPESMRVNYGKEAAAILARFPDLTPHFPEVVAALALAPLAGAEEEGGAAGPALPPATGLDCGWLTREQCVRLLEAVSIQCYDAETVAELQEAVRVNVEDGTIPMNELEVV
jgi:hypothetical protein